MVNECYELDTQNTNTIVEVLQSLYINIPDSVHIKKIKYESCFHDFKLTITYMENNEVKTTEKIIDGNNVMRSYFRDNSTNMIKEIETVQRFYITIYIIIILIIIVYTNRKDKKLMKKK